MENRRFIALGDLIADCYYIGEKLIGVDGGSSRYNVIANLANTKKKTSIIGGCGNDTIGKTIIKRYQNLGVDTSKIFLRDRATRCYHLTIKKDELPKVVYKCSKESPKNGKNSWYDDSLKDLAYCYKNVQNTDVTVLDTIDKFSLAIINNFKCDKMLDIGSTSNLEKL